MTLVWRAHAWRMLLSTPLVLQLLQCHLKPPCKIKALPLYFYNKQKSHLQLLISPRVLVIYFISLLKGKVLSDGIYSFLKVPNKLGVLNSTSTAQISVAALNEFIVFNQTMKNNFLVSSHVWRFMQVLSLLERTVLNFMSVMLASDSVNS